jgi:holo-ACP synthase / triphosphoribosyl-dephospho-CoA synthase
LPVLSLSLNIPGFPKSNDTVKNFFRLCLCDLSFFLKAHLINVIEKEAIAGCDAAGDFYVVPVLPGRLPLHLIKQFCEDFEQSHPLGRFIDVDLNDQSGNTLSSGKSKMCFFCLERPAIDCRRENAHEPEELRSFMFPQMESFCRQQRKRGVLKKLSSVALQAILAEISLTPKPGLVAIFSNGSHTDMNFNTFMDSTAAISPWFDELVNEGFTFGESDLTRALPIIRSLGLRMESAMYAATRNVNTQKGIIFLMGLSLFASGMLFSQNDQFRINEFREIIRGICKDMVSKELNEIQFPGKTHGTDIFLKYGISGARGEAESGFATVFDYGLPQFDGVTGITEEAMMKCFLAIAANNQDTNILFRSSPGILNSFQELCQIALEDFNPLSYSAVNEFCKINNISPGGSADLLAVTIFVWSVMNSNWY